VLQRSPAANQHGLIGGLWSAAELCVNPRTALSTLARWLADRFAVRFEFNTTITRADSHRLGSSGGRDWQCDRAILCGGADCQTLFPRLYESSGLLRCKLQMLRTASQADGWKIGPLVASGLTLRHYASFAACSNLAALKSRIANETPELNQFGIHVMASQNDVGEVILGDSHEYDQAIEPFDKPLIDELIVRELQKVIRLPDWSIQARWHGVYVKHPTQPCLHAEPLPGIHICTGTGGSGMTMAFGLAEQCWERWI
jgi:FAD dependent oxidoreductase TIGR03364